MEDIRECISRFFKDLKEITKQSEGMLKDYRIISSADLKFKEIMKLERDKYNAGKNILEFQKKIEEMEGQNKALMKDVERIKGGEKYIEEMKKREESERENEELRKEVYRLKNMIDFKSLAKTLYTNEKKMKIVKEYKEDFQNAFWNDSKKIVSLLDDAGIGSELISKKVEEVIEKEKEIDSVVFGEDETLPLVSKMEKIKLEIENLENRKPKEKKRRERIEKSRGEIVNSIRDEITNMNVELV